MTSLMLMTNSNNSVSEAGLLKVPASKENHKINIIQDLASHVAYTLLYMYEISVFLSLLRLSVNASKCNQVSYTAKHKIDTNYYISNNNTKHFIENFDHIKDLGVTFDSHLSFYDHIQEKINKADSMIGLIKRNFIHMDKNTFCLLYKALVRLHVEYAHSVWCPYKKM